jgi:adenosylcobinamide-GDP ribazoletransferase
LFGHAGRERALEIMKDSRIGTYGALALIGSVAARAALLADLAAHAPGSAALALLAAAGASRGAMAWFWSSLPSARPGGLSSRMEAPNRATGRRSALVAIAIAIAGGAAIGGLPGAVLPALLAGLGLWLFRAFVLRRLGGATGDTLGAAQQTVDVLLLLGWALSA